MKKTHTALVRIILISFLFTVQITSAFCQSGIPIPIKSERNITLVTVKIGNVEIPNIILDTGFPFDGLMIYNPSYRDSVNLTNAVSVNIGGAGSGAAQSALMIDSAEFFLDKTKFLNQRIIILQSDIYKGFPSNGIIGYSLFGHYVVEIDYDKEVLILHDFDNFKTDQSWTRIPMYFKDNSIPWIDASVVIANEKPITLSLYLDYAAGDAIVLLEKPSMKFTLPQETTNVHIGTGLSGDIYGKTGRISELVIGPYVLKSVAAAFAPADVRSKQSNADAILGGGSLRRFNLLFDYENRNLYLKPNKYFNDPFK